MLLILRPAYQSSPDPNQSKLELVQRYKRVNHLGCDENWYCIFSPSPRHTYRVANTYATSWGLTFKNTPLILSLEYSFTKIFFSQTLNTDSKLWGFYRGGKLIVIISNYWNTKVSISKNPSPSSNSLPHHIERGQRHVSSTSSFPAIMRLFLTPKQATILRRVISNWCGKYEYEWITCWWKLIFLNVSN